MKYINYKPSTKVERWVSMVLVYLNSEMMVVAVCLATGMGVPVLLELSATAAAITSLFRKNIHYKVGTHLIMMLPSAFSLMLICLLIK